MSFNANPINDDENDGGMNTLDSNGGSTTPQPAEQQAGPQLSQESGTVQNQAPSAPKATSSKTAGSGMFTNLQKYVKANKPKTKQMAGSVVKDVSGKANNIKTNITNKLNDFTKEGSTYSNEQKRLSSGEQTAQNLLNKASSGQSLSDQEVQSFQKLKSGTGDYSKIKGPDFTEQSVKAKDLTSLGNEILGSGGSERAVNEIIGKNIKDYTEGERGLDKFLLGGDNEARNIIHTGVSGATEGLTDKVGLAQSSIDAKKAALANMASRFKSGGDYDLAKKIKQRQEIATKNIDDRLSNYNDNYKRTLMNKAFSDSNRYGVNTDDYMKNIVANRENITSAEDAAKLNALSKLSGDTLRSYKAGTFDKDLKAAISKASSDISTKRSEYESGVNELKNNSYQKDVDLVNKIAKDSGRTPLSSNDALDLAEWHLGLKSKPDLASKDPNWSNSPYRAPLIGGKSVKWEILPSLIKKLKAENNLKSRYGFNIGDTSRIDRLTKKYKELTKGQIDIK